MRQAEILEKLPVEHVHKYEHMRRSDIDIGCFLQIKEENFPFLRERERDLFPTAEGLDRAAKGPVVIMWEWRIGT